MDKENKKQLIDLIVAPNVCCMTSGGSQIIDNVSDRIVVLQF